MAEPLYRRAQGLLREYIAEHRLRPGDPLPPEAELAETFGMSRLSLREAVKGLETVGLLKSRQGGGVYVAEFSFQPILENLPYSFQLGGRNFRELLELRASLEEGLAARVLQVIRPIDLDTLDAIVRSIAAAERGTAEIAGLDRQFHLRMFEPLQNQLVLQLIELFWNVFHELNHEAPPPPSTPADLAARHAVIVDALRSGDEPTVVRAIRDHFAPFRDWVLVHGENPPSTNRTRP